MSRPVRAMIHLQALQHNLVIARQHANQSRVMAVIKANGYGHGMASVAHALIDAEAFAVASVEEAIELREVGISQPIVLLEGPFSADELGLIRGYQLQVCIHNDEQIEMLEQALPGDDVTVWLKLDTGMHRLGFTPEQAHEKYQRLFDCEHVEQVHLLTHFACADTPEHALNSQQNEQFTLATTGLHGQRSLANSAALLRQPASHADWVRPGIMLYGASPLTGVDAASLELQPVMTLRSELIAIKQCRAGDSVGYGAEWQCPEDMPVGVVAIGYGDGYPRHAPPGTPVMVNGKRTELIGRVSMDMITVDLRPVTNAQVGSEVVLWGDGLPADEVAQYAGTIAYDLFCGITNRVPRVEC
jgi:alanine racemase